MLFGQTGCYEATFLQNHRRAPTAAHLEEQWSHPFILPALTLGDHVHELVLKTSDFRAEQKFHKSIP